MTSTWYFSEKHRQPSYQKQFGDLDRAFSVQGESMDHCKISQTLRVAIDERRVYVKKYSRAGSRLRRYLGRSKIRGEWENLRFFKSLNIPTPEIVACGERSGWIRYDCGVLVMEEVENSLDLRQVLLQARHLMEDKQWVIDVATQVTACARKLHQHGFVHGDFKFRNILIRDPNTKPRVYLIDCPIGRRRYGFLFERARIKDLFELDKYARTALSKSMRLRCYLRYRGGQHRLTAKDRRVIRAIMKRHARHPETRVA